METEIVKELLLTDKEKSLLDMHSLLNIITILIGELQLIALEADDFEIVNPSLELCNNLRYSLADKQATLWNAKNIQDIEKNILDNLYKIVEVYPSLKDNFDLKNSIENIKSVFNILNVRVREILARVDFPDKWESFEIEKLKNNFTNVFSAMEKNSKGGYRVLFDPNEQGKNDYYVIFNIKSVSGNAIKIPSVFQDVMRDLMANARKYTAPGGVIKISLEDDGNNITFLIKDTGRGIPEKQINSVVDFGFRAQNVLDRESKGGGFGLTKAYYVTKQFKGRMWIDSELNKGTKITIKIPSQNANSPE